MMKFAVLVLCLSAVCATPLKKQIRKGNDGVGGRIIGGSVARAGQFPFAASLYISRSTGTFFCSGALITNRFIVTAGQCVTGAILFTIRLGTHHLTINDANTVRVATEIYHIHPSFDPATLFNDIGLIELRVAVSFSDYLKPVDNVVSTRLPDSSSVVTIGWGQISDSAAGVVEELHYVYLTSLSNEACRLTYGTQVTDNVVCVDGNYNEGTCRGDSGSPLFQLGGAAGHVYLVGVSSFISQNGCESPDPSGFTRTSSYYDWINNNTLY